MARVMKDSGIKWCKSIPLEWQVMRLKYAMDNYDSQRIPIDAGKRNQEGDILYDYYGASGVIDQIAGYTHVGRRILIGEDGANLVLRNLPLIYIADGKYWVNNHAHILAPKHGWSLDYFVHQMECVDYFEYITGSAQPKLSQGNLNLVNLIVPPIQDQELIASFLNTKCSEINELVSDIQAQIETLEQYKRSIITEAVTKGLNPNVPMKDSQIPWIGKVPAHWKIYRIADLYEDRNERGNEGLPLLSVSINTGVSDKELSDDEQDRIFLRSEDKSKYKRVYPGDITYNMMRAWQGAFGAVRVEGMVSPAYVVAKQKGLTEIDSRFIEALIRSPMGIEEMNRFSYGIMDFRKRLYWPQFKIMKVCLPVIDEQRAIADYIDSKSVEIDAIIDGKRQQLATLEEYKKSVIFEYVTGKKEVPVA